MASSSFKFTEAAEKVRPPHLVSAFHARACLLTICLACISQSLNNAVALARENSNINVAPVHVASALLDESNESSSSASQTASNSLFANVLDKAGADVNTVRKGITRIVIRLPAQDPPPEDITFSSATLRVLRDAQKLSKEGGDTFIGTVHLISALVSDAQISSIIKEAGSTEAAVKSAVSAARAGKKVDSKSAEESFDALNKYAINLTELAAEGKLDPVIARDDEIRRVIRILSRRTKNNPVLIGEPGVGKTAVVEGLAQRIIQRDVPVNLLATVYALDMGALMAGASYKGQYEERVKAVIEECEKSQNVILFIDEMHLIVAGQGNTSGGMDAANLLKPALARGKLRCIGATTLAEYRKYIEKDQALVRRFQEVLVNEPDVQSTISILRGIREKYELHHGVSIGDAAVVQAATLAHRYLTTRKLPDAAIDLIDEACAAVRVARDSQPEIIDKLERSRTQLEVEIHALERENERAKGKDESTKERLEKAKADMRKIDDELNPLKAQYEAIKSRADEIQSVKERIEELKTKADNAERNYDIATASDIRYYSIPDLQQKLNALEEKSKIERKKQGQVLGEEEVTPDAIADIVARWTGIPANKLKQSEKEKLMKMEKILSKEIVGQPEAIKAISNAIRLSRSGLANADKPLGSFLFAGSTGTGKTWASKCLAKFLFDDKDAICRIDASEYSEKHAISRLIGAPPGYVGHENGGVLTEWVRRKPFSIVLIDEIEKASKEFTTLFLQVLDDGRLTDSEGRVVSFKNTVIIMTTNLGSQYLNALPSDAPITDQVREQVNGAIRAFFLPEFLNRIDEVVIFNVLSRKEVRKIVDIRLAEVQKRLAVNGRKVTLDVDEDAKDWLASAGYNPVYGARPLNRTIQHEILNPLSKMLIEERIKDGEKAHITADLKANRIVIQPNHDSIFANGEDEDMDEDMDIDGEARIVSHFHQQSTDL